MTQSSDVLHLRGAAQQREAFQVRTCDQVTASAAGNHQPWWRRIVAGLHGIDEAQVALLHAEMATHYPERPAPGVLETRESSSPIGTALGAAQGPRLGR